MKFVIRHFMTLGMKHIVLHYDIDLPSSTGTPTNLLTNYK